MHDLIIETNQLCCRSGRRYLIESLDWQVRRGEHWCVFGPNGCGKTTLLSIVAGYHQPSSGTVRVLGQPFANENIRALRRRIGWVSSSFFDRYFRLESALAIVLSGKVGGFGLDEGITSEDVKRAKALLGQWRLADKADRPFALMSKGERQSVLLARAFMSPPELLILDEPCSGLDIAARRQVLETVRQVADGGATTVIYVTHYAEEILPLFGHTLMLKDGRAYAQGQTDALFRSEVLGDFLGQPVTVCQDARGWRQIALAGGDRS